ncbi:hypothetical protein GCM10009802_24390 [Streptomyces synnematoformans]|uniref:Uncharacterized protein n=1 Tax=Streptomyces synnematoformans TaxID=415721 RepID=A0ABP5JWC6_9ACTN
MMNEARQVSLGERQDGPRGGIPAAVRFRVPKSALGNMRSRVFNGASDELNCMLSAGRSSGPMHDYGLAGGPVGFPPSLRRDAPDGRSPGRSRGCAVRAVRAGGSAADLVVDVQQGVDYAVDREPVVDQLPGRL